MCGVAKRVHNGTLGDTIYQRVTQSRPSTVGGRHCLSYVHMAHHTGRFMIMISVRDDPYLSC